MRTSQSRIFARIGEASSEIEQSLSGVCFVMHQLQCLQSAMDRPASATDSAVTSPAFSASRRA